MGKAQRSPLLGYNHNIRHHGRVFHVQTEDSVPNNPRLFTHLFHEGTILVSRKHDYDAAMADDKVREIMKAQHKSMIRDLMQTKLDERVISFFRARGEELTIEQGATPLSAMAETPRPNSAPATAAGEIVSPAAPAAVAMAAAAAEPSSADDEEPVVLTPATQRRSSTRSIEAQRPHTTASSPSPAVIGRPVETRRQPPFVRSGAPAVATTSSTDGVVVQRSVVVGTGSPIPVARSTRIRPPGPYVVTGNGGSVVQPGGSPPSRITATLGSEPSATAAAVVLAPAPAPISAVEAPRPAGGFGPTLTDDKSLDEVILEYLSDDTGTE